MKASRSYTLQQHLPFTVLKRTNVTVLEFVDFGVATVLTACGIETQSLQRKVSFVPRVATVLTVYGIETNSSCGADAFWRSWVARVLTVYGI